MDANVDPGCAYAIRRRFTNGLESDDPNFISRVIEFNRIEKGGMAHPDDLLDAE